MRVDGVFQYVGATQKLMRQTRESSVNELRILIDCGRQGEERKSWGLVGRRAAGAMFVCDASDRRARFLDYYRSSQGG